MQVAIIYRQMLDSRGENPATGGIETYLLHLGRLCHRLGFQTTLYQVAESPFNVTTDAMRIVGIPVPSSQMSHQVSTLLRVAERAHSTSESLVIFGADHFSIRTRNPRAILIQHGIHWDLPCPHMGEQKWVVAAMATLKRIRQLRLAKAAFENAPNRVCVDHNFLNWYRTVSVRQPERTWVIPNFAPPLNGDRLGRLRSPSDHISVLFARRFYQYRGTRLFAEVAKQILSCTQGVVFTFAGEGPEERWLRAQFAGDNRVRFTCYRADDALEVHARHDIAVVPSLGSEGTSFAVAEALAAGCAVLATNVGGITNMILNGYNGLLVMPTVPALRDALLELVNNDHLRSMLSLRARQTAESALSHERWSRQWEAVLSAVAGSREPHQVSSSTHTTRSQDTVSGCASE